MAEHVHVREASAADVEAMSACRLADPDAGPADERMAAYFAGRHHPQQAHVARIGFVAVDEDETIVGYVAGHLTTRHGCGGEVQYLFVAPGHRRRRVATTLAKRLLEWFRDCGVMDVCVCVDGDNPAAHPFYVSLGAKLFRPNWVRLRLGA